MRHLSLNEESIIASLEARDREEALRKMVNALPVWCLQGADRQKILELLVLREQIGTTAIGHGIALPHCFYPGLIEPIVAFGVSPQGIPYHSLDGRPVHFIFLLILPQGEAAEKQKRQILQNIKWFLCDRSMQERLRAAHTAADILQWVHPSSPHVPAAAG